MNDAFSKRGGMLLSSLWIVLIIHVLFLVDFLSVLEVSLVQKCRYEKVCSSRLIHTSLHWCLIGF